MVTRNNPGNSSMRETKDINQYEGSGAKNPRPTQG